jgi:hypothetical protein
MRQVRRYFVDENFINDFFDLKTLGARLGTEGRNTFQHF